MFDQKHGLRPCAVAMAVALALGLTGCGGGSGVQPTPAAPLPPPATGGGSTGGVVTVAADTTLKVASGDSISKPVLLERSAVLDNAGIVGGTLDIAVEGKEAGPTVLNHDGGSIKGTRIAVLMDSSGTIRNSSGGTIEGGDAGITFNYGGFVSNDGVGSIIGSPHGMAVQVLGQSGTVENTGGGTITSGSTAIYLEHGGKIVNARGSIIETTGAASGDCATVGVCSIFVASDSQVFSSQGGLTLLNAGTIIGNVQMIPTVSNAVTLTAGGSIHGDLSIGSRLDSFLTLNGESGTTQLYSQAVTGRTTFAGDLDKSGDGTWIIDNNDLMTDTVAINGGMLQVGNGGTEGSIGRGNVAIYHGMLVFDHSDDITFEGNISSQHSEAYDGTLVQAGTGTLTLRATSDISPTNIVIKHGTLQIDNTGNQPACDVCSNTFGSNVLNDGSLLFNSYFNIFYNGAISGAGSVIQKGSAALILQATNTYTGGTTISNGTLQLGNGGTTGSIIGEVTNNGLLVFNRSDDVNFNNVVSGRGAIAQTGSGTLTLSGTNTYTGGSTVQGGTLRLGSSASAGTGSITVDNSRNQNVTLKVDQGVSLGNHVLLNNGATLDNAGLLVDNVDSAPVESQTGAATVLNHDGGNIAGGTAGLLLHDGAVIRNGTGSTISGISEGVVVSGGNTVMVSNEGGSIISSQGRGLFLAGASIAVTNSLGGLIEGGNTGIHLFSAGAVINESGGIISGNGSNGFGLRMTQGGTLLNDDASIKANGGGTGVDFYIGQSSVINTNSASIESTGTAINIYSNGTVTNSQGSTISGSSGVVMAHGGSVTNQGNSIISASGPSGAIGISGDRGVVNNLDGSMIAGTSVAIVLGYGGAVTNGIGSTIKATGVPTIDCQDFGACAIYVSNSIYDPGADLDHSLNLVNAGNIIGNVQLHPDAANHVTLTAGSSIHGDLLMGTNAQSSLTLNGDNVQPEHYSDGVTGLTTFAGTLIKEGTGTWLIDSNDFSSVAQTQINGGRLQATKVLAGMVNVGLGGTLDAAPGVAGTLSNAGTVAVHGGNSTAGNYSQSSTGTLAINLGSKLDVTGAATLNGGTLEITGANSGYASNTHTEVLTASGGVTGTFDQLVKGSGVVFAATTINYNGNSVWLDTTGLNVTTAAAGNGVSYTPASFGSAQRVQGAFEQLDNKIATGALSTVSKDFVHAAGQFQQAPSLQAAQASLQSLSGQLHAASAAMTFKSIDASSRALSDRFDNLLDKGTSVGGWMQNLNVGGDMARTGFDSVGFQLNGWMVGSDRQVGHSGVAGYAFGQSRGQQQLDRSFDHDTSRGTEGMLYAGWLNNNWYAQGRVGFGQFQHDVSRQLLLGESSQGVRTQYNGRYNVAYGESGLHFGQGDSHVTPFLNAEYARINRDGFAEQGAGGFGLRSDAQTLDRWQVGLGVRANRHWDLGREQSVDFSARAQWQRTLASHGDVLDASFVGLQQWQPLTGVGLSRYSGLLGIGLDAKLSARAALKFSYDYEMGQHDQAQMLSARLSLVF